LPGISCNLPGGFRRAALKRLPIWSCTRWGLPCPPCRHGGGELLPRHFNLTCERSRAPSAVSFLWHFPPVARGSRYEPPRPMVFGLSSPADAGAIMHSPLTSCRRAGETAPPLNRLFGRSPGWPVDRRGRSAPAAHGQPTTCRTGPVAPAPAGTGATTPRS